MTQPDFGDLRSLLNQPHTPQVWDQLCLWVGQWSDEASRYRIMPYIEGHLQRWTDEQRKVPSQWIRDLARDTAVPWMMITKTLYLRGYNSPRGFSWSSNRVEIDFQKFFSREELVHIHRLDLGENKLQEDDLRALVESTQLESLTHLELQRNTFEHDGMKYLMRLKPLTYLGLRKCKLTDAHIEQLCSGEHINQLKGLDLFGNQLTALSVRSLNERAPNLETLNLGNNPALLNTLTRHFSFSNLHTLNIERTKLETSDLEVLLANNTYKHLNLWDTNLKEIASILSQYADNLQNLESLNLGKNALNNDDIKALVEIDFTQLKQLNLYNNHIGDRSAEALAAAPWISKLDELNLGENAISSIGKKALRANDTLKQHIKDRL